MIICRLRNSPNQCRPNRISSMNHLLLTYLLVQNVIFIITRIVKDIHLVITISPLLLCFHCLLINFNYDLRILTDP